MVAFVTADYAAASFPGGGGFVAVLLSWFGLAGLLLALDLGAAKAVPA